MIKKIGMIFKIIALGIIALIFMYLIGDFFRPKYTDFPNNQTVKIEEFYNLEEDSLGILFLGSSHIYYGIDPALFYKELGTSSYALAGECQSMTATNYYFKEALKTQKPELVVVDLFSLMDSCDCQNDNLMYKNVQDFKWSDNKIDAIIEFLGEEALDGIFEINKYHSEWKNIDVTAIKEPVESNNYTYFGHTYGYLESATEWQRPVYTTTEEMEPNQKYLASLEEIVNTCKEENIEILLIKTPYYQSEEDFKIMNYLKRHFSEMDVNIFDMNENYTKVDYIFDLDGEMWHVSSKGTFKVAKYLSQYIDNNYEISKNDTYEKEYTAIYDESVQMALSTISTGYELINLLRYMDVSYVVTYQNQETYNMNGRAEWQFNLLGLDFKMHEDYTYNYLAVWDGEKLVKEIKTQDEIVESFVLNGHNFEIDTSNSEFVKYEEKILHSDFGNFVVTVISNENNNILLNLFSDTRKGFVINHKAN